MLLLRTCTAWDTERDTAYLAEDEVHTVRDMRKACVIPRRWMSIYSIELRFTEREDCSRSEHSCVGPLATAGFLPSYVYVCRTSVLRSCLVLLVLPRLDWYCSRLPIPLRTCPRTSDHTHNSLAVESVRVFGPLGKGDR